MKKELKTKGRRDTVLELIESVLSDYHTTRASLVSIGAINKVSAGTVAKIVSGKYCVYLADKCGSGVLQTKFFYEDGEIRCYMYGRLYDIDWVKRNMKFTKKPVGDA